MAIAFLSSGAGVATETSGAALSPLCPATVNANDILIAHVFWEGTTSAPSTPSGWTLLHGPAVIESTIARHWVFGKIAAGTEDGAAVAFGNPAVTTQRGARVYSFSGYVSGSIAGIVSGFSHQSHATDPQMPTVQTLSAGGLAVALVAQNDNNTAGNATGETGGDWTEAVAEFVAALTPGLMMQLQSCTPTGNPGTVSGGSVATTNDPCGVIGFAIHDSIPATTLAAGQNTINLSAPDQTMHLLVPTGANTVEVSAPTGSILATMTLSGGLNELAISAPTATLVAGAGGTSLAAGANTIELSGPSTTTHTAVTQAAGGQTCTLSAPTATILATMTLQAGSQTMNVSAPTVPALPLTMPAGDQLLTLSVPSATVLAETTVMAGSQTATVNAPSVPAVHLTMPSGAQTIQVSAPTVPAVHLTMPAGSQTVQISNPTAIISTTLPAGGQTVELSAPISTIHLTMPAGLNTIEMTNAPASLVAEILLTALAQELRVSAPAATLSQGLLLQASDQTITLQSPSAALVAEIVLTAGGATIAVSAPSLLEGLYPVVILDAALVEYGLDGEPRDYGLDAEPRGYDLDATTRPYSLTAQ